MVADFHLPPFLSAGIFEDQRQMIKLTPQRSLRLCGDYSL